MRHVDVFLIACIFQIPLYDVPNSSELQQCRLQLLAMKRLNADVVARKTWIDGVRRHVPTVTTRAKPRDTSLHFVELQHVSEALYHCCSITDGDIDVHLAVVIILVQVYSVCHGNT